MKLINITKGTIANEVLTNQVIGDSFVILTEGTDTYLVVTDEQADSFEKVVTHQGRENYVGAYMPSYDRYVLVNFKHIQIGIEADGYAHS